MEGQHIRTYVRISNLYLQLHILYNIFMNSSVKIQSSRSKTNLHYEGKITICNKLYNEYAYGLSYMKLVFTKPIEIDLINTVSQNTYMTLYFQNGLYFSFW